jgi:hypothetical protein
MKEKNHITTSEPDKSMVSESPVREPDIELTPKAEAKAANKLPRAEQLNKFEKDLEVHDSGNQPA